MDAPPPLPAITVLPDNGGYEVAFVGLTGKGGTLEDAFAALSAAMRDRFSTEKGDETAEAETARRQTDILANDRLIRGNTFQGTVLLAAALGLM